MSEPVDPVPLAHLEMAVAYCVSDVQARAIWHAVAETRAGKSNALAVHAELIAAGYTPLEANTQVEEVPERLADRQPADPGTDWRSGPGHGWSRV